MYNNSNYFAWIFKQVSVFISNISYAVKRVSGVCFEFVVFGGGECLGGGLGFFVVVVVVQTQFNLLISEVPENCWMTLATICLHQIQIPLFLLACLSLGLETATKSLRFLVAACMLLRAGRTVVNMVKRRAEAR